MKKERDKVNEEEEEEDESLTLSLSLPSKRVRTSSPSPAPSPPPQQEQALFPQHLPSTRLELLTSRSPVHLPPEIPPRTARGRRNQAQTLQEGRSATIPAPFPWATTQRATVHSFKDLLALEIRTITGQVKCKHCEKQFEISYDLKQKVEEIGTYTWINKASMRNRAPERWMHPVLPKCRLCGRENSAKPVIAGKEEEINWLFLFLGEMIGCCTIDQLKYFCKHTKNHRTGAKDRVLYSTYIALCDQLWPTEN